MIENFDIKNYSAKELYEIGNWYTIQAHFNNELAVQKNILNMLKEFKLEDKIHVVLVPTESIIYIKDKKETIKEKALYSGYVFICTKGEIEKDTMLKISKLPKVSRFIEYDDEVVKLTFDDFKIIIDKIKNKKAPRLRTNFVKDDKVKIEEGSFMNFNGIVESFEPNSGILKINVNIFGRPTPVELHYKQVSMIE